MSNGIMATFGSNMAYKNDLFIGMDIYSTVKSAKRRFYSDLQSAMTGLNTGGKVRLSNGQEIDVNSLGGMQAFGMHMNLINNVSGFVDDIFGFVKKFESNLGNQIQ